MVTGDVRQIVFDTLLRSSTKHAVGRSYGPALVAIGLARYKDERGIQSFELVPEETEAKVSGDSAEPPKRSTDTSSPSNAKSGDDDDALSVDPPVIDEPLILLRLAAYYEGDPALGMYNCFARRIKVTSPGANGWENYVALCMLKFFAEERPLTELFVFQERMMGEDWVKEDRFDDMTGKIVGVVPHSSHTFVGVGPLHDNLLPGGGSKYRPQPNIGYNSNTIDETLRWVRTGETGVFLFPDNFMGPDILFLLELNDDRLVWVAVQCKFNTPTSLTFEPSPSVKTDCMRSTTPANYYIPNSNIRQKRKADPDAEAKAIKAALHSVKVPSEDAGEFALHSALSPPEDYEEFASHSVQSPPTVVTADDVTTDGGETSIAGTLTSARTRDSAAEDPYGYMSAPASPPSVEQARLRVVSSKRRIGDTPVTDHAPEDAERMGKKSRANSVQ
ncbi:hypothetical protein GGG16DRAFT_60545 [Schizophyllum commune]